MTLLKLDSQHAWFESIRKHPSPHCDARPLGTEIELIVVHGISLPPGEFGGHFIEDLFTGTLDENIHPFFKEIAQLRVSAHLLIRRDGEVIQYVSLQQRAWHAGISSFQGRTQCNDFSIGIELEGCDDVPYTELQYQQLARIITTLQQTWSNLTQERIVGHSDIAPERKTDPGHAFDWHYLYQLLAFQKNG